MKSKSLTIATVVCISLLSPTSAYAAAYVDLNSTSWATPAIEEMAKMGYIGGYEDGTFKPSKEITRAELLTIINKMNNFTEETEISFSDVSSSNWAYREIKKAVAAGYVSGFGDNTFKPNENVTREQIAVMLNNLYELETKEENINIADLEEVSFWAKEAVKNVVSNKIMSGYSDGTFGGKRRITRAEGVVALHNVSDSNIFIAKKESKNQDLENIEFEDKVEQEIQQEQIPNSGQTGTSGGGSNGGSSGGGSSASEQQEVNEKLQRALSVFNNRVVPKYTTDNQKQVADIISESIERYLNDSNYDISSDVQSAKDIYRNMTQEERKEFELITTGNMDITLLMELNRTFNIVNL